MIAPERAFILQRVIPHYRKPLFDKLHDRYGLRVLTARRPPQNFLKVCDPSDCAFAAPVDMTFPNAADAACARIPLAGVIRDFRPSLIIAEFGLRLTSTYALPMARRRGVLPRFGFWTHGWQMERGFKRWDDRAVQLLTARILGSADAVGTYSAEGAARLSRGNPGLPVVPLGNALDSAAIAQARRTARPVSSGDPQLLAIGRLTHDKRFDVLLRAYGGLKSEYPGAALTIIGDGPERARLESMAAEIPGSGIRFLGALHDETDLAPHFLGASLLVIPGAAGLSVNHALAYALPVVAYARADDGPRHHPEIEYVRDGVSGALVRDQSVDGLRRTIAALIGSNGPQRLRAAMAAAPAAPTLDDVVDNFGVLLDRVRGPG